MRMFDVIIAENNCLGPRITFLLLKTSHSPSLVNFSFNLNFTKSIDQRQSLMKLNDWRKLVLRWGNVFYLKVVLMLWLGVIPRVLISSFR